MRGFRNWASVDSLRKLPGFRTRIPWKMALASAAYLAIAVLVLYSVNLAVAQRPSNNQGQPLAQLSTPSLKPSPPANQVSAALPASDLPSGTKLLLTVNRCGAPANPWGYNFCRGRLITRPPSTFCRYFHCITSFWRSTLGYVDQCRDGTYSHSGGRRGACSYHRGELRPLYRP